MGIYQLITYLKRFNSEKKGRIVVADTDFTSMEGLTIAIDVSTLLYAQLNGAIQAVVKSTNLAVDCIDECDIMKIFYKNLITRMETFLRIQCSLVIAFDGEAPELKSKVREERRKKRQAHSEKIKIAMDELNNTEPLDRTPSMINELKKLLMQEAYIPDGCLEELRAIFELMGFTVIQATGEAERTCSALCKSGLVDAVYSTDSDCLVHGCPITVTKIKKDNKIEVIVLENVLNALELEFDEFVELCICSGCDYNQENNKCIPNCRIAKLYPLFKEYRTYKAVVERYNHKYDFSPVNMKGVKPLFEQVPLDELMEGEYYRPSNCIKSDLRLALDDYQLSHHVGILLDLYSKYPERPPSDDSSEDLE